MTKTRDAKADQDRGDSYGWFAPASMLIIIALFATAVLTGSVPLAVASGVLFVVHTIWVESAPTDHEGAGSGDNRQRSIRRGIGAGKVLTAFALVAVAWVPGRGLDPVPQVVVSLGVMLGGWYVVEHVVIEPLRRRHLDLGAARHPAVHSALSSSARSVPPASVSYVARGTLVSTSAIFLFVLGGLLLLMGVLIPLDDEQLLDPAWSPLALMMGFVLIAAGGGVVHRGRRMRIEIGFTRSCRGQLLATAYPWVGLCGRDRPGTVGLVHAVRGGLGLGRAHEMTVEDGRGLRIRPSRSGPSWLTGSMFAGATIGRDPPVRP